MAKKFRVTWTEEYEKVFEAPSAESAIENRDDDNAFCGCSEVNAVEVCPDCENDITAEPAHGCKTPSAHCDTDDHDATQCAHCAAVDPYMTENFGRK